MPAALTTISQKKRFIAIDTPLGKDVLGLVSLSAREELGRLFQFDVEMVSDDHNINFDDIIGQNVTVRLETDRAGTRYLNGYVSTFHQTAVQRRFARYQATIVPWLWLLTRKSDCRIYQNQTIPQIIQDVFKRSGVAQLELRLTGKYQPWEYCVQYRETDFNFVSRLMEQEGIYYFFTHQKGKHTLVLCDSPAAHEPCPGYGEVQFRPEGDRVTVGEYILDWSLGHELRTTRYAQTDYDFKVPTKPLLAQAKVNRKHAFNGFEIYDYPGEYIEHAHGQTDSKVRIQELQCRQRLARGHGDARGLLAGHTFTLQEYARRDQNCNWLLLSTQLTARTGGYESEDRNGEAGDSDSFHCAFAVADAKEYFRPERTTPKPVVQGPQTATVVGPKGEEIHTDAQARVKVHFHWDRHDKRDQNSSCWIRVSQPWAGKGWGSQATPRIGQEVIVEFLEGDPDQPIITGRVYNGDNPPPYGKAGVVSGLKSQTHKGAGSNEMSLDDTAGAEEIKIHGQYDMNTVVEHDQTSTIHNNRTDKVDVDDSETVGNNQTLHVVNNRTKNVDVDEKQTIGSNETIGIGKNMSLSVGMMKTENVGLASLENVGAAKTLTVGAVYAITVTGGMNTAVGMAQFEEVGSTKKVIVGSSIEITCGSSKFQMDKSGKIKISGTEIEISGSDGVKIVGKVVDIN